MPAELTERRVAGLPSLTSNQVVKALHKCGFEEKQRTESHLTLHHPATGRYTTVPLYTGGLFRELVRELIKEAGLTEEEFRGLL